MSISEQPAELLGLTPFVDLLRWVVPHLDGFTYGFLHPEPYRNLRDRDVRQANRVYWFEILEHLAAATALLRQHRWLEGIVAASAPPNFLAFAACLRGFIESSADIWDGLGSVPSTLGAELPTIRAALAEELAEPHVCEELENRLRHFQFARRIPGGHNHEPDQVLHAKQLTKYLSSLERSDSGPLSDLYSRLCSVTHPWAESLLWFSLGREGAEETHYRLKNSPDAQAVRTFCDTFAGIPQHIFQQGLNLPLMTLKVVNAYRVAELYTTIIDELGLDRIPAWREIQTCIDRAGPAAPGR